MKQTNILIVGVGGQGTLLASVLLGNLGLSKGYDVKLSEVHGMAQRGGSVVTHVKISEGTVSSPLIEEGDADVIIAFEELEAYRWLPYLKNGRNDYVNTQKILPMPVIMARPNIRSTSWKLWKNMQELLKHWMLFPLRKNAAVSKLSM